MKALKKIRHFFAVIIMCILVVYILIACILNLPLPMWIDRFMDNKW